MESIAEVEIKLKHKVGLKFNVDIASVWTYLGWTKIKGENCVKVY